MKTVMWAICDHEGEPLLDTLSESADGAIRVVADRINATAYEELARLGFGLERVTVELKVLKQESER